MQIHLPGGLRGKAGRKTFPGYPKDLAPVERAIRGGRLSRLSVRSASSPLESRAPRPSWRRRPPGSLFLEGGRCCRTIGVGRTCGSPGRGFRGQARRGARNTRSHLCLSPTLPATPCVRALPHQASSKYASDPCSGRLAQPLLVACLKKAPKSSHQPTP